MTDETKLEASGLWHKHTWRVIGHTESLWTDRLRIHYQCRCGKRTSERLRPDHPSIDESSHGGSWSGYTWWMHKPMPALARLTGQGDGGVA